MSEGENEIIGRILDKSEEIERELENVSLDLKVEPKFDFLAVLICDPENPHQYVFKTILLRYGSLTGRKGKPTPYVDIVPVPLRPHFQRPVPEAELERAAQWLVENEETLERKEGPSYAEKRQTIAVAEYEGEKPMTVDSLLELIGHKYIHLRQEYMEKKVREN